MTKCFLVSGSQVTFSGSNQKGRITIFCRTEGKRFSCDQELFRKIDRGDVVLVNENKVIKVFKKG